MRFNAIDKLTSDLFMRSDGSTGEDHAAAFFDDLGVRPDEVVYCAFPATRLPARW